MTPAEIEALGLKHYGTGWMEAMATDLGVNRSTVWRWHQGLTPPNADKLALLTRKLKRRKK